METKQTSVICSPRIVLHFVLTSNFRILSNLGLIDKISYTRDKYAHRCHYRLALQVNITKEYY